MNILKFPNPKLRIKAQTVKKIDTGICSLLDTMAELMYLNKGVGLAATQVGVNKQLVVLDTGQGLFKLINPEIIKKEGSEVLEEGCLSVPETCINVKRSKQVTMNYMTVTGDPAQIKADGLFARAVQHEIDHLRGILIVDYANPIKKYIIKKKAMKRKL